MASSRFRFRTMEQFATAVAKNVLREQQDWLTDTFPQLFIKKIQDTLSTSTPRSTSGEQHKRKLQEFVAQALAPTAELILQQSRQEILQPVKEWYMSRYTEADPPHVIVMLQALLTEALTSALEKADAGNQKAVENGLREIKGLLKLPRTLQPPSSPLANTELRDGHRTWAYYKSH